jgi:hypothetical protein
MSKAINYGTNLAIIGGIGNGAINLIQQVNRMGEDPDLEFNWKSLLTAIAKGGVIGGTAGLIVGGIVDYQNSVEEQIDTDAVLFELITQMRLTKRDDEYVQLNKKADDLIRLINTNFQTQLADDLIKGGSSEKNTALRSNFDIDIYAPFKPNSYTSTRKMMDEVFSLLEKYMDYLGILRLRQQVKSIGVFYNINGKELKIDVVPYKITEKKGNKTSGYLHVRKEDFWGDSSTYTKTDIHLLNNVKLNKTQEKILVALKAWKHKNELPMSSHLLQCFILEAYACNSIPRTFSKKIVMVLEFIMNRLDISVIRSVENSNNILTNISDEDKSVIICACREVIEDYEYQPNSIVELIS